MRNHNITKRIYSLVWLTPNNRLLASFSQSIYEKGLRSMNIYLLQLRNTSLRIQEPFLGNAITRKDMALVTQTLREVRLLTKQLSASRHSWFNGIYRDQLSSLHYCDSAKP